MKDQLSLLPIWITLLASLSAVVCASDGVGEWQILTERNFSSQIRLHPHTLLLVTVPWCGESRSLMRQVSRLVTDKSKEFDSLKLMFIYRNTEKMLADSIGASEGITGFYYHHSGSYKYQGKLRARNILNSIYPYISASPEELPLKPLNSQEELKVFLESTDKALILAEFCGWAPRLLAKVKNNGTGNYLTPNGMENGNLKCVVENGIAGIPWITGFSLVNDSGSFLESENLRHGLGLSCTLKEFKQFDSFFSKLIAVRREFLMPPERFRFGLVSDRSLMSSLGVEDSGTWMAVLYFKGCPGCSKVIKDGDKLKSAFLTDDSVVRELEVEGQDLQLALPANKPSVILFVDRSSGSLETRRKSREALDAFREVALCYQLLDWMSSQNTDHKTNPHSAYKGTPGHSRLQLSETAQKIKLKDKMSFMIINEGKHVTVDNIASDLQGKSLHEILAYLLQRKNEAKLSSLARELGLHLLSDDLDIKMAQESPSQTEGQSNDVSPPPSLEGPLVGIVDPHSIPMESKSAMLHEENPKLIDVEPFSPYNEDKGISSDKSKHLISIETEQLLEGLELNIAGDLKAKEKISSEIDKSGEQELQFQGFKGSFFLCDDNYRLLRSLTGGSSIPSLVLVDPRSQHHYVYPDEAIFSYFSLANFLHEYLNGSLVPYQRSAPILHSPREATSPPFVNQDFHEMDSIPRVTMHTMSKLVFGFNQSNSGNAAHARNEDVVVLFSSNWCGFCQRMELVVREVYRAIRGYMEMMKSISGKEQAVFNAENSMSNMKLPLIYLMDCTLNDCSLILKSVNKREVYPSLMIFPAETETAVSYEGDMSVANIIKFIADHGHNSRHLFSEKGILLTTAEGGGGIKVYSWIHLELRPMRKVHLQDKFHEVILKNQNPKRVAKYNGGKSRSPISTGTRSHKATSKVVVGSILMATDKLLSVIAFDKSRIIIVKAEEDTGFLGLIFNKQIRWDNLDELEEGFEFLKEAPLSFGGPVLRRGMPFVALTRRVSENQYLEVLPGIYFLDQLATVANIEELKAGNQSINDYWFFFGYTSWGWHQLFDEIGEGAWTISNDNKSLDWPAN
ncbi:LOW QUALITY PROTEIN: uncharacterized protein LOC111309235 [Durio zibethinus]|uniref:LOW QUALITY PROTEIN: uncharacterized protein LOC111309235 n=1 Tax=Durio zibethinus TaxID=66656 RepID=A0A6P6AGN4_DURZI|nr:LOW QUALITY PROTEIN: uncharacterized protein LOC111309235 [Durio zibethinus]